jgi:hypothetical protein
MSKFSSIVVGCIRGQRYNKPSGEQNKRVYFLSRGAVYLQAAKQIKISARRAKMQVSTSEDNGKVFFSFIERGRNSTELSLLVIFRAAA